MLMSASTEYVTLCQSQVTLLIQTYGVSKGAVYLTQDLSDPDQATLIPVVVYPEDADQGAAPLQLQLPASRQASTLLSPEMPALVSTNAPLNSLHQFNFPSSPSRGQMLVPTGVQSPAHQIVLPLIHDDLVLGLLVVAREQQRWSQQEQTQLEQIASTLAIACVLDQRSQWLGESSYQQRALQSQQHQTLSDLLHQFRNPLTALRTLGKLLLKRFQQEDTNRPLAESIVQQSDHLEELLQQFDGAIDLGEAALELDFSAQWQPDWPEPTQALLPSVAATLDADLVLQPCWVAELLHPLLQSEAGRLEEHQQHLLVEIPADLPPVYADAAALREVLGNLVDNALKYTPDSGQVRVVVYRQPSTLGAIHTANYEQRIEISDSGPGIPAQDLERIFERHYRGVQAEGEIPGTGLGLAIARHWVQQMQGQIQARSPALDRLDGGNSTTAPGSTLIVTLPEAT